MAGTVRRRSCERSTLRKRGDATRAMDYQRNDDRVGQQQTVDDAGAVKRGAKATGQMHTRAAGWGMEFRRR